MQTATVTTPHIDSIYSIIGDAGPLTSGQIATLRGEDARQSDAWLRGQEVAGYLYRDEFGAYGTSCPWPRAGF